VRRAADVFQDLAPGLEAAVDQVLGAKRLQRGGVIGQVLRLAANRAVPLKPEPPQVFEDRSLERRPAALGVDVLDAQN